MGERHDEAVLAGWSRDVAGLLGCEGSADLPARLGAALGRLAPFDLSTVFVYPQGGAPACLYDGLGDDADPAVLRDYLRATHVFDPFSVVCRRPVGPGLYRMRDLAPDAFFAGEYHADPTVHPCISMQGGTLAEEIGYLFPLRSGAMAAYSVMRRHGRAAFSVREFARLAAVEPVVRSLLGRHWRAAPHAGGGSVEAAFAGFAADRLTPRQRQVVQLLLQGHSTASVAASLGLSEATVKTHRKAIHHRLGISTQAELFAMVTRSLLGRGG